MHWFRLLRSRFDGYNIVYGSAIRGSRDLRRRTLPFLSAFGAALLLLSCTGARAAFVQAQLQGVVSSPAPIPALAGQPWTLTFVFDTEAPEDASTAPFPNQAKYLNTGPVKVLRSLDFSVGSSGAFTIHLVDPVPASGDEVRIDVDNFGSKTFNVHVDDVALLPAWNGLQLDQFLLVLTDSIPGGYFDGTDHLPSADPTITLAEFNDKVFRLNIGPTGQFTFIPSSFALVAVPEMSTGALCAVGGLAVFLFRGRFRRVAVGFR
jgi:hypothetical protein